MGDFLVKKFVKNYENVADKKVRENYGMLSSMVGIFCNIALFATKFLVGSIAHSIAIISDGFNNLSDCASCVVTIFGYKLSAKPADKDHPFGHGRMEYLTSMIIALVIGVVGVELFRDSLVKIFHPDSVKISAFAVIAIAVSILIKLWMAAFNMKYGKKINSSVMLATSKDSISDVMATSATLISLIASIWTDAPVDGIMGVIVSVLIVSSGIGIIKETVDELIGKPADPELVNEICGIVDECESAIGIHDMIIHNYGPGNLIGSMHIEVDCRNNIMDIHDDIDLLERHIWERLGVGMTIHMDPVETDNETLNKAKMMIAEIISQINEEYRDKINGELTFHDFRMVSGRTHTNIIFDIVLPRENKLDSKYIEKVIVKKLEKEDIEYHAHITFDLPYV